MVLSGTGAGCGVSRLVTRGGQTCPAYLLLRNQATAAAQPSPAPGTLHQITHKALSEQSPAAATGQHSLPISRTRAASSSPPTSTPVLEWNYLYSPLYCRAEGGRGDVLRSNCDYTIQRNMIEPTITQRLVWTFFVTSPVCPVCITTPPPAGQWLTPLASSQ